jgi:hypothetical protein
VDRTHTSRRAHRRIRRAGELIRLRVQIAFGLHFVELAVNPLELTLIAPGFDLPGLVRRFQALNLSLQLFSARLLAHLRIHSDLPSEMPAHTNHPGKQ